MAQPPYGQPPQSPQNQPPYGQTPPYGQQPQYGQVPQYGQAPQYGQQPQYGQAPQGGQTPPPYGGQSQYGAPGPYPGPGGPGGYGPPKQGNGFSVAGVCLCILPLFGLIFSIIGLVKSKERGGAGRTLGIVGIVLSVIVAAVGITVSVSVAHSTAADPGCVSAEATARNAVSTVQADSSNPTKLQSDLQSMQSGLEKAQGLAVHQSVKDAIGKMSSDMNGMMTAMHAAQNGDESQISKMESYANKVEPDGAALDKICAPFGGTVGSGS